jgi:predicted dehydrogenase/dTDP-4-amino-4,6-dideoxygalactose transaminase
MDSIRDRAEKFAHEFQVPRIYDSYEELLRDPDVTSVSLCVPHHLHAPLSLQALRAGKHVLVEKPVLLKTEEESLLADAARASRCVLMPVVQHRFDPLVIGIAELLAAGELGAIRLVRGHLECARPVEYYRDSDWRGRWLTEGGSVLINQGYHMLDLMLFLGGSLAAVDATMTTFAPREIMETEDTLVAGLTYKNGALGSLTITGASGSQWNSYIELLGESGEIAFTINSPSAIPRFRLNNKKALVAWRQRLVEAAKQDSTPGAFPGYYGISHRLQARAFIAAIQGQAAANAVTFAEAVSTVRVAQDIYRCAAAKREAGIAKPTVVNKPLLGQSEAWCDTWEDVRAEDAESATNLIRRGEISIVSGGLLGRFEKRFAAFAGAKEAVAFCNGTSSLYTALWAVGVRAGDEVMLCDYAYHGTASAILALGARLVICDCLPDTLAIDPSEIVRKRTAKTRAIMVHNPWGVPAQFDHILDAAEGIPLISDASHAHGATFHGRPIAAWADVTCFSLGRHKLVSGGELGCAVTDNVELRDRMLLYGHVNRVPAALRSLDWQDNAVGLKFRPHPLAISLAMSQLSRIEEKLRLSRSTCQRVERILESFGFLPQAIPAGAVRSYWKLVFRLDDRYSGIDTLTIEQKLRANGIPVEPNHYWPLIQDLGIANWPDYQGLVVRAETPQANQVVPRTITLPAAVNLTEESFAKLRASLSLAFEPAAAAAD